MPKKEIILPKLPRGMGSYDWKDKAHTVIRYRKRASYNDVKKDLIVYGHSIAEVNANMKDAENDFEKTAKLNSTEEKTQTLEIGINNWLQLYKIEGVANRSFDRVESTYLTHIVGSDLGRTQEKSITSDMIQMFMKSLTNHKIKNNKSEDDNKLSYSSKKKVYELLNQYFRYKYIKEPYMNPMLTVTKPINDVTKVGEELIIFDDEEINQFCFEAMKQLQVGVNGYKHGAGIVFILWTFIRIGEALALQWKDIDIENETINITKSYSKVKKRNGNFDDGKFEWVIVKTKNKQNRKFKMCKMAVDAIKIYKTRKCPKSEDEFVFTGEKDSVLTITSVDRMYKNILKNAELDVKKNVTLHGLRHTGISYFLRHGVPVEVVSRMAGHQSIQITIDIYYSVIESQKMTAIDTLNNITNIDISKYV